MSDSDNSDFYDPIMGATLTPYYDYGTANRQEALNFEGKPTQFYDDTGLRAIRTRNGIFDVNSFNPILKEGESISANTPSQATNIDGQLLFLDSSGEQTTRNTGIPMVGGSVTDAAYMKPIRGGGVFGTILGDFSSAAKDPYFHKFLAAAAAMGGAAAFAPSLGGAAGAEAGALGSAGDFIAADMAASQAGQGAFNAASALGMPLDEAVTAGLIAGDGSLTSAGAAALMGTTAADGTLGTAGAGLTGSDLLKYGQIGLKGLGALSSLVGAAGNVAGNLPGNGGSGATAFPVTNSTNYASPVQPLSGQYLSTGQATEKPFEIKRLEMLHPQANQIDPQILSILSGNSNEGYGVAPTEATQQSSGYPELSLNSSGDIVGYASGGEVQDQGWMYGHPTHVAEFKTGTTGHHVQGAGDGQSDDIPAMLADGEYVFDADTVAALGNGSNKAGAGVLDKFREALREHKRSAPADKIPPKAAPLTYLKQALKD